MRILHYRSDVRSVACIALAVLSYAVQWLGLVRHPLLYGASLCLAFVACVINHNHQHHPTFVPRALNKIYGGLISLATGFPAIVIVAMHNHNHHVHNNQREDHIRAEIVSFRFRPLNLLLFPFVAIANFAPHKVRALREWNSTRPALKRQLLLERFVLYPTIISLVMIRPGATFTYFLVPYLFGGWCILAINHVQHVGCDPDSKYNHSRNVVGGWLNWWLFNNGYHTAHHLRPGLHWSRLPALHEKIRDQMDVRLNSRSLLMTLLNLYVLPSGRERGVVA